MGITVATMTTKDDTAQRNTGKPSPRELLNDPNRLTLSVTQAADLLGICRSTASLAYRRTGFLTDGVRVLRAGKRCIVPVADLRRALGLTDLNAN